MNKFIITMALGLTLGLTAPAESFAASTTSTTQAAPKKATKKNGTKKTSTSRKYVPVSIGDCYLGYAKNSQGGSQYIELTLYTNGSCEWKADGKLKGMGTFSGTISGGKYVVKVDIPSVGNYTFKGNKEKWSAENSSESITLNLEH